MLEPLGPQKHSIFIEKVSKFKLVAIFALDAALGPKNHPKTLQISPPSPPKGTPEEPRSAQERPRRAPRASQNHPQRALRVPLGVQKVSWGGFGSLGASFWSPQGQFYLLFLTFPNVLFSLLSLFSHICYYVHPLFFSLFSSPFSLLASLFALLFGLSNGSLLLGLQNPRNRDISNLIYLTAFLVTFRAPPLQNSSWLVCQSQVANSTDPPPVTPEIEGCRARAHTHTHTHTHTFLSYLCSLFASSLLLFFLSVHVGTIWALFWSPWDLNNIENHPKTLQMLLQGSLKSQDVASDRSGRYFYGTSVRSGQDVLRFSALLLPSSLLFFLFPARVGTILASF